MMILILLTNVMKFFTVVIENYNSSKDSNERYFENDECNEIKNSENNSTHEYIDCNMFFYDNDIEK